MHILSRECKELAVIRVDGNLPKAFGEIHCAENSWIVESLQRVLDARERVNHLVTLLIDFAKISKEAVAVGLLLGQEYGGRVGAC